jgi:hypothetical protein
MSGTRQIVLWWLLPLLWTAVYAALVRGRRTLARVSAVAAAAPSAVHLVHDLRLDSGWLAYTAASAAVGLALAALGLLLLAVRVALLLTLTRAAVPGTYVMAVGVQAGVLAAGVAVLGIGGGRLMAAVLRGDGEFAHDR